MGEKLVFMEENQSVAFWGIQKADLGAVDPVVREGGNAEPIEWYSEGYCLSRFLMAIWNWAMTGEQELPEAGQPDA